MIVRMLTRCGDLAGRRRAEILVMLGEHGCVVGSGVSGLALLPSSGLSPLGMNVGDGQVPFRPSGRRDESMPALAAADHLTGSRSTTERVPPTSTSESGHEEAKMTADFGTKLVSDKARAMIGTVLSCTTGVVAKQDFQRWAAAVNDRNPLYFDAEFARSNGYSDVVAPPLYVQYVTLGVVDLGTLRPDGIPGGDGAAGQIPLPNCPRRMAGGQEVKFHEPLYDGDVITAIRTVTGIVEKQGRSGAFVLVSWKAKFTRQDGELVAEINGSTIARP
jgi:acyl dehydratase